jgi:hypothetical protein
MVSSDSGDGDWDVSFEFFFSEKEEEWQENEVGINKKSMSHDFPPEQYYQYSTCTSKGGVLSSHSVGFLKIRWRLHSSSVLLAALLLHVIAVAIKRTNNLLLKWRKSRFHSILLCSILVLHGTTQTTT